MQIFYVTLAALAPAAVLLWYIYRKDSNQPAPTRLLIQALVYGIASALITIAVVMPFGMLTGFGQELSSTISGAFTDAFLMAAIPEELAKFVMLWLLLRNNPYFDEHFDGIVYAVCIGMGFAGFENVLYLFDNYESWISVGIARAMFAVPGHFLTAVIMGYYYSLWHFQIVRNRRTCALILAGPILAHGIYDGILFSMNIDESLSSVFLVLFLLFFNKLRKIGKNHIAELVNH